MSSPSNVVATLPADIDRIGHATSSVKIRGRRIALWLPVLFVLGLVTGQPVFAQTHSESTATATTIDQADVEAPLADERRGGLSSVSGAAQDAWGQRRDQSRTRFANGPRLRENPNSSRVLRRTVFVTSALAAACVMMGLWNRHRASRSPRQASGKTQMNLLGTLSLAPRCYLQLVSVNEQHFLVARDGGIVRCMTSVGNFDDAMADAVGSEMSPAFAASADPTSLRHGSDPGTAAHDAPSDGGRTDRSATHPSRSMSNHQLSSASNIGLSLEANAQSDRRLVDFESSIRRSDPWQGSLPNQS